jgi:hypothetical protein
VVVRERGRLLAQEYEVEHGHYGDIVYRVREAKVWGYVGWKPGDRPEDARWVLLQEVGPVARVEIVRRLMQSLTDQRPSLSPVGTLPADQNAQA